MADEQEGGAGHTDKRGDAEDMARLQEQINNLPVSEHVLFMMQSLSSLAVDRLGLVPEAAARRDPEQARLAIDAFKALLVVLEPVRPTAEIVAHRGVLSQLQMAYVGALGAGAAAQEPEASAAGEGDAPQAEVVSPEQTPAAQAPAAEAPKKATKPRAAAKGGAGGAGGAATKGTAAAKGGAKKGS